MNGAATVAVANKKIVDEYCKSLQVLLMLYKYFIIFMNNFTQAAGLTVSMAPDDDFEPSSEGGEE